MAAFAQLSNASRNHIVAFLSYYCMLSCNNFGFLFFYFHHQDKITEQPTGRQAGNIQIIKINVP